MLNEPVSFDLGLTGKYTLTPTVTLDFALNPDFAQVGGSIGRNGESALQYSFRRNVHSFSKA